MTGVRNNIQYYIILLLIHNLKSFNRWSWGIDLHPTGLRGWHYNDVIMSVIASQLTSLTIVYSTVYSGADQRKHQSSATLAFVWGIHRWPVNSPHKWPVTRKMFPFDDVIMNDSSMPALILILISVSKGASTQPKHFHWRVKQLPSKFYYRK